MAKTASIAYHKPIPNPKMRLFCFHHAGGGASSYRDWQPYFLPLQIEIVPIQMPGRENRIVEPCAEDVPTLIAAMAEDLMPYLDRPYALWGHSMGAILAYEFGRLPQEQYQLMPAVLFASASDAPGWPLDRESTTALSDPEFIEFIKGYGGLPDVVLADAELQEIVLPALRADFALYESYAHQGTARLECPIFCYGGVQDMSIQREALMAWEAMTSKTFKLRRFPGDHFYTQSQVNFLMKALMQDLARAGEISL